MHPFPMRKTQLENANPNPFMRKGRRWGAGLPRPAWSPTAALVHKRVTNENHLNHVIDKRDY